MKILIFKSLRATAAVLKLASPATTLIDKKVKSSNEKPIANNKKIRIRTFNQNFLKAKLRIKQPGFKKILMRKQQSKSKKLKKIENKEIKN